MSITFNPLIFSGFDFKPVAGYRTWAKPVADSSALVTPARDGEVRVTLDTGHIWVYNDTVGLWIDQSLGLANVGSTPAPEGYSLENDDSVPNLRTIRLTLQPADATNPGVLTASGLQVIGGNKTFNGNVKAAYVPVAPDDVTNKAYVDSVSGGLKPKFAVVAASVAALSGTWNYVGSPTFTLTPVAPPSATNFLDGVTVVNGDRVLLKDQADAKQNGIYVVTVSGGNVTVLTRSADANSSAEVEGLIASVLDGTVNISTKWVNVTDPFVLDTDPVTFTLWFDGTAYVAGQGMVISGNNIAMDATSTPTLTGLFLSSLNQGRYVTVGASGQLVDVLVPASNQLTGYNNAGNAPENKNLLGTGSQVTVTHGVGTITLSLPQNISSADSPTFTGLSLSGPTKQIPLQLSALGAVEGIVGSTNALLGYDAAGTASEVKTLSGTANRVTVAHGVGTITLNGPQDIHSGATPTFLSTTLTNLTASLPVVTDAGKTLVSLAGTANQLVGYDAAGTAAEVKSLAGTSNQVSIAHSLNTITFSLPQDIHTGATPTFLSTLLSGLTASLPVVANASKVLSSLSGGANYLVGYTAAGNASEAKSISGTANQVTVGHTVGAITLSLPQDIHTGATPTFADLTLTAPATLLPLQLSALGSVDAITGSANAILGYTAAGAASEVKTLSGTANQVTVTHGVGTIGLSLPQDIATGSSPTFNSLTLSTLGNNLPLQAGPAGQIQSISGVSNRVVGFDAAGTATETKSISGTAGRLGVTHSVNDIALDIATSLLPSPTGGEVGYILRATGADNATWQDPSTALAGSFVRINGNTVTQLLGQPIVIGCTNASLPVRLMVNNNTKFQIGNTASTVVNALFTSNDGTKALAVQINEADGLTRFIKQNEDASGNDFLFQFGIAGTYIPLRVARGTVKASSLVKIASNAETLSSAARLALQGDAALLSGASATTISGQLDDVSTSDASTITFTGTVAGQVSGFANPANGKVLVVAYIGSATLTLLNNSASSLAANRMQLPGAGDLVLNPNSATLLQYNQDSGQWIVIGGAGASGATTALDNLTTTAINTDLLPDSDLTWDLGSATAHWNNLYVGQITSSGDPNISGATGMTINSVSGNTAVTSSAGSIGITASTAGQAITLTTPTIEHKAPIVANYDSVAGSNHVSDDQRRVFSLLDNVGSQVVFSYSDSTYIGAIIKYSVRNNDNSGTRTGTITLASLGTGSTATPTYADSSVDCGATVGITFSVDQSGGNIRLLGSTTSNSNQRLMRMDVTLLRA